LDNIYPCEELISAAYYNSTKPFEFKRIKGMIWYFCEQYVKHKGKTHPHDRWTRIDWTNIINNLQFCRDQRGDMIQELSIENYKPMIDYHLTKADYKLRVPCDYSFKFFMSGFVRGHCYFQGVILVRK